MGGPVPLRTTPVIAPAGAVCVTVTEAGCCASATVTSDDEGKRQREHDEVHDGKDTVDGESSHGRKRERIRRAWARSTFLGDAGEGEEIDDREARSSVAD